MRARILRAHLWICGNWDTQTLIRLPLQNRCEEYEGLPVASRRPAKPSFTCTFSWLQSSFFSKDESSASPDPASADDRPLFGLFSVWLPFSSPFNIFGSKLVYPFAHRRAREDLCGLQIIINFFYRQKVNKI
jgi:hypothetical protein